MQASDGNFYGTSYGGGANGGGTLSSFFHGLPTAGKVGAQVSTRSNDAFRLLP